MPLLSLLATLVATFYAAQWAWGDSALGVVLSLVAVFVFVVVAVRRALDTGLPVEPCLEPVPQDKLLPVTVELERALAVLGFQRLGDAHEANVSARPTVLPFVHREVGVLAAIYQVHTPAPRAMLEFVTTFACGTLMATANAREAGTLPVPAGRILQTRHGADAAALFDLHQQGVAALRVAGRNPTSTRHTALPDYMELMRTSLREQRAQFDGAPLRTTLTALARALFALDPCRQPVAERVAQGELGATGGASGATPAADVRFRRA